MGYGFETAVVVVRYDCERERGRTFDVEDPKLELGNSGRPLGPSEDVIVIVRSVPKATLAK